jgi:hypothetical protein
MKNKFVLLILLTVCVLTTGWFLIPPHFFVVEFISHESKHMNGDPIYNRIYFHTQRDEDIWMMQQQQKQYDSHFKKWDRLAIIVNRKHNTTEFYQLQPGPLEWTDQTRKLAIPNKVNCLLCHSNGPRGIRPDPNHTLTFGNRLLVKLWNNQIKRYPKLSLELKQANVFVETRTTVPKQLRLKACSRCHNDAEDGRNFLSTLNQLSIQFMLENKFMPPQGENLSKDDLNKIVDFLK